MLYSVIIPVYNVEKYIERCVFSVIKQTMDDYEIILVDDGSTDGSATICDKYAENYPFVKVIHKENGGLSDARNKGLAYALGEYIVFLDSDDYIVKNTLKMFFPYTKEKYDIIIGCATDIGKSNHITAPDVNANTVFSGEEYLLKAKNITTSACLSIYRRSFLEENHLEFKYGILHEDVEFTPRAILCAKKMVYTGVNFYRRELREGSISRKHDYRQNAKDHFETMLELEKLFSSITNMKLRRKMLDELVTKTLFMFQLG